MYNTTKITRMSFKTIKKTVLRLLPFNENNININQP